MRQRVLHLHSLAFVQVLRDDIFLLLEQYCYEDYDALGRILETSLVHHERKRSDETLFRPGREKDIIQALLEPIPDLTTLAQAIASEAATLVDEEEGTHEAP